MGCGIQIMLECGMPEIARPLLADEVSTEMADAVREGIAAADAGRVMPYEEVRRWLLS